jgi:drug/metabolite transporter (DMT)-like permease
MDGFLVPGKSLSQSLLGLVKSPYMWLGALFYIGGTLGWFFILSRHSLSYVYPMVSIGYILTAVLGVLLFHETIPWTGWLGMGIVLCGFVVLSIR